MGVPRIEKTEKGIAIISAFGNRVEFDENYEMLIPSDRKTEEKYFFRMDEEKRELVRKWAANVSPKTQNQKKFIRSVKEALSVVNYDYCISTIEPTLGKDGMLYFEVGKEVARGLSLKKWRELGKAFMPERRSRLSTFYELFIFYAYRIARKHWTIEYVCDDSSSAGNYFNSPDSEHFCESSGAKKVGGFYDGIGNTYKIVSFDTHDFRVCGGAFSNMGYYVPVSGFDSCNRESADLVVSFGTGVISLLE